MKRPSLNGLVQRIIPKAVARRWCAKVSSSPTKSSFNAGWNDTPTLPPKSSSDSVLKKVTPAGSPSSKTMCAQFAGCVRLEGIQIAYSYIRFSHADQLLGDSERRQSEAAEAYAREHGMALDTSLKPDRAVSAFRGRHRKKGNLAAFLKKVHSREVKPGSALIVESLDRLSREEPEFAYDFLREITSAGIEVHTILDKEVYRSGEMDELKMFKAIITHSRSSQESKRKSERCAEAAAKNRDKARDGVCISARVPGWLRAVKGVR